MSKVISNKHFSDVSQIVESAFTESQLREGEIIVSSDIDAPGLFIHTHSASTEEQGSIVKINSTSAITRNNGDNVETFLTELQEKIDEISGASISVESSTVEVHTEAFIGDDGKSYPAGKYLKIVFKKGTSVFMYTYSEVSALFVEEWFGTQEEYEALETKDPNKTYNTYED